MDFNLAELAGNIIYKEEFERNLIRFITETNSSLKINEVYKIKTLNKKVLLLGINDDYSKFFVKEWKKGMPKKFDPSEIKAKYIWISKNLFTF